ncbi:hypothetical protein EXIGLDRAFT_771237 [Exidia glandulosa HHB12029]|uniref:Uncharacterized protein n=1 Tax=Exidia glandulosa HHB12029 TaxID=1314781 RepID=A0A165G413_EXIGL|nr:hypothetical protein EXIGLDRAFT_771237 [Exidia glandulosa HHB12029]
MSSRPAARRTPAVNRTQQTGQLSSTAVTTPAAAHKRARPNAQGPSPPPPPPGQDGDGDDDDDDEDQPDPDAQPGEKRKIVDPESSKNHPLNRPGRHFGRTVEAFGRFLPVLEFGIYAEDEASQGNPLADVDMSDEERKWDFEYKMLALLVPDLREWINEIGVKMVAIYLTNARKNARGEDAKKVKDHLHAMRAWTPTLVGLPKDQRGMRHDEIAGLIAPPHDRADVMSDDPIKRQATRMLYIHRQRHLDPELWPAFLYHNFKIYPHNVWRGLLKSNILVVTAQMLLHGPRALTPGAPIGGRSNAVLNDMSEMTIPTICYAATLLYFALSSDTEFQPVPAPGGFAYKAFYDGLKQHIESQPDERRQALLAWWNARVFTQGQNVVATRPAGVKTTAELLAEQGVQADDDVLE